MRVCVHARAYGQAVIVKHVWVCVFRLFFVLRA